MVLDSRQKMHRYGDVYTRGERRCWLSEAVSTARYVLLLWLLFQFVHDATANQTAVTMSTVNVTIGSNAVLPCRNETPGTFFGIVWMLERQSVPVDIFSYLIDQGTFVHDRIADRAGLVNETSLMIKNVSSKDAGVYHCNLIYYLEAHLTYKVMVAAIVTLHVVVPPRISVTPSLTIASIDDDVSLKCNGIGNMSFHVTWSRNDSRDLNGLTNDISSPVLRLNKVSGAADGVYVCVARNEAGVALEHARLIVKVPPRIRDAKPVHINVGKSGRINCVATGYPEVDFRWRFTSAFGDEVKLSPGGRFANKINVRPTRDTNEGRVSTLVLKNVKESDFRSYTCYATNSQGTVARNFTVTGYTYAERPVIYGIRTSSNKAIVSWKVPDAGGTKLDSLTLQYRNETKLTSWKAIQITPATVESYTIMDLQADTKYEFRMFATNEVGDSPTSAVVTSWTKKKETNLTVQPSTGGLLGNLGLTALIGIVAGAFLALLIAIIIVMLLVRRLQKTTGASQTATPPHSRPVSMENGSSHGSRRPSAMPAETPGCYSMEMEPLLSCRTPDQWEFPRSQLRVSTVLGSGAFGMVMRGEAQGINGTHGVSKVAIKMVRDNTNDIAKKDLQAELDVLKLIPEHQNVVGLKGCCSMSEPLMVIVEYCANGDLQGFLRSSRGISERYYRASYGGSVPNLTSKMLLTFASQVARGMNHLASLKVIHRDLAARNVLVDDRLVCKVSDFGFARDVYVEDHYMKKSQGGRFPIKWMAIESLIDGISTTKSDVWSFGVVLWEIVTLGASPYPGMNSYEVVSFLQDGYRMEKPKHCSEEIYAMLLECWNVAPQRRRSFGYLSETFLKMTQEGTKEYINMNYYQDHLYENFDVSLTGQSNNIESETTPSPAATTDL